MQTKWADRADFLCIYIKEAHPTDEWQMDENEKENVCYPQPKTIADRQKIANDFVLHHRFTIPLVVDDMQNVAEVAYSGWPERLYVIDEGKKIAFKGEQGPFGFKPDAVEKWLTERFGK